MNEPHQVLGVEPDADDETIRRRYLELVREFPPERNPEKFATGAYVKIGFFRTNTDLLSSAKRSGYPARRARSAQA